MGAGSEDLRCKPSVNSQPKTPMTTTEMAAHLKCIPATSRCEKGMLAAWPKPKIIVEVTSAKNPPPRPHKTQFRSARRAIAPNQIAVIAVRIHGMLRSFMPIG